MECYEKALAMMPVENITPGDLRLKEQAQAGAKSAKEKLSKNQTARHIVMQHANGRMPWHRAEDLVNERIAKYGHTLECANSSVSTRSLQ